MVITVGMLEERGMRAGSLTVGDSIELATDLGTTPGQVALEEAALVTGATLRETIDAVLASFKHNLSAVEKGLADGHSFILGAVARELADRGPEFRLFGDPLLDRAVLYTLAAQVGNHEVGLQPCAGTGDSCPYTGVFRAIAESGISIENRARVTAIMLKVGTLYRTGKSSTGCNMEGFGAGAAACAAAFVEFFGGTPRQMNDAMSLAISPTVGVPCTPRVLVPALCATHIGGAVALGYLGARLAITTTIPVNVDVDVMMALAAAIHPVSAERLVPVNIRYLEPFFRRKDEVEAYISPAIRDEERKRAEAILKQAKEEMRSLASRSNPITQPFGEACVGGSSQAVGSPTNCGRIAYALARGRIRRVLIELYPELFARRGINAPGILMGAVYGRGTGDSAAYKSVLDWIIRDEIEVEIVEVNEPQCQRVTLFTDEGVFMVHSQNRGGGRLALVDARPSIAEALETARRLGIVVAN